MDSMEGQDGIERVRAVFEKAITSAGLHVTEVLYSPHLQYAMAATILVKLYGTYTVVCFFIPPVIWHTTIIVKPC